MLAGGVPIDKLDGDATFLQAARVIVNVHREQACSYRCRALTSSALGGRATCPFSCRLSCLLASCLERSSTAACRRNAHCIVPSSRLMMVHLPSALSAVGGLQRWPVFCALAGAQSTCRPCPCRRCTTVMPLWSTIMPSFIMPGSAAKAIVGSVSAAVTSNAFQD